jgi:hypothetical protein
MQFIIYGLRGQILMLLWYANVKTDVALVVWILAWLLICIPCLLYGGCCLVRLHPAHAASSCKHLKYSLCCPESACYIHRKILLLVAEDASCSVVLMRLLSLTTEVINSKKPASSTYLQLLASYCYLLLSVWRWYVSRAKSSYEPCI